MKNLNVLLGVVFGLIVGAGAVYVGMGTPTEQPADETAGFTTQSVRGGATTTSTSRTTTTNPGTEGDSNGDNGTTSIKVNYNIYGGCTVTFDDGSTLDGNTSSTANGTQCCWVGDNRPCYTSDLKGVTDVNFNNGDSVQAPVDRSE